MLSHASPERPDETGCHAKLLQGRDLPENSWEGNPGPRSQRHVPQCLRGPRDKSIVTQQWLWTQREPWLALIGLIVSAATSFNQTPNISCMHVLGWELGTPRQLTAKIPGPAPDGCGRQGPSLAGNTAVSLQYYTLPLGGTAKLVIITLCP